MPARHAATKAGLSCSLNPFLNQCRDMRLLDDDAIYGNRPIKYNENITQQASLSTEQFLDAHLSPARIMINR